MNKITLILLSFLVISLSSCGDQFSQGQNGAVMGAAAGAIIGQAIGRDKEATLIGAAVGTMLGYIMGNEMDKFDRQELNQAYEFGKSGQTTTWTNPDSGNNYKITPQPVYTIATKPDRLCRMAEIVATIDGKTEKTYTTACRNAAGQWELQN
ncbi:glycine zipper domain-containing protein [Desulfomarina sp.]